MSVVNAASVQSVANEVAVMVAAVVVAAAVLSEAKVALIHVANAALKVVLRAVLNALQPKAVQKVAAKVVAVQNAPAKLAQTCAPKAALRASPVVKVNPAAKAVVTATAVIVQNEQREALSALVHLATPPRKNWLLPIKLPWQPLLAVK